MRRGTTPTHVFNANIDLTDAEVVYLTYKQGNKIAVEKSIDDLTITSDSITAELTQEDTLAMRSSGEVFIQIRARFPGGSAVASNIIRVPACEILKDGVI